MASIRTQAPGYRTLALAAAVAFCFCASALRAETRPGAGEDERWLVLATRAQVEEAIGVAQAHGWREDVRVARDADGRYAALAGPFPARAAERLRERLRAEGALPAGAFLSDASGLEEIVWRPPDPGETRAFVGEPLTMRIDALTVRIAYEDAADPHSPPLLEGFEAGARVFSVLMEEAAFSRFSPVRLRALALDVDAPQARQLVVTSFTGGAHCCAQTRIFNRLAPATHAEIDAGFLDGDEGYAFEDLDGSGTYELTSGDNSFLYAFAPYARSFMPLRIERLHGTLLRDARDDPALRHAFVRDLARLEHEAELSPDLWNENGFLAAWVATKANLGQIEEAWSRMLAAYDRTSDWPLTICLGERIDGECPEALEREAGFPEALQQHLRETGYLPRAQ